MLAEGRRLTVIWSTETRLTLGLATVGKRGHGEVSGVLSAKGNRVAEEPELQRVATDGGTGELHFRPFDEPQHHEPLHHRIGRVDRLNYAFLAGL